MTRVGDRVADFELLDVRRGATRTLRASLRGRRAVVVVFWSGVCSHCQHYDAWLSNLALSSTSAGSVGLLAVACRQGESLDDVRRVIDQRALLFDVVYDADRALAHAWQIAQTPVAFVIDESLDVRYRGAIDNFGAEGDAGHRLFLAEALDDVLASRPVRRAETPTFGCPIESVYY